MKNSEKYENTPIEELMDISAESRCRLCNEHINKNLSPTNPACEGSWCDEALDIWLEQDVEFDAQPKNDSGKLKISLVPTQIIRDIAEVREYGCQKYHDPDNWMVVELDRYIDALLRHTLAFMDDVQSVDDESGIPHYKHMACNMAFLCEMLRENR